MNLHDFSCAFFVLFLWSLLWARGRPPIWGHAARLWGYRYSPITVAMGIRDSAWLQAFGLSCRRRRGYPSVLPVTPPSGKTLLSKKMFGNLSLPNGSLLNIWIRTLFILILPRLICWVVVYCRLNSNFCHFALYPLSHLMAHRSRLSPNASSKPMPTVFRSAQMVAVVEVMGLSLSLSCHRMLLFMSPLLFKQKFPGRLLILKRNFWLLFKLCDTFVLFFPASPPSLLCTKLTRCSLFKL